MTVCFPILIYVSSPIAHLRDLDYTTVVAVRLPELSLKSRTNEKVALAAFRKLSNSWPPEKRHDNSLQLASQSVQSMYLLIIQKQMQTNEKLKDILLVIQNRAWLSA